MDEQKAPKKIIILDDHELVLAGTLEALKKQYPDTQIITALTAKKAKEAVKNIQPDLLIVDLAIPNKIGETAQVNIGIELLRNIMDNNPYLNIVVLSSHTKALVRIKSEIQAHQGGFTVADKTSLEDLLKKVSWSMNIISYTKDIKELQSQELKLEWYQVLELGSRGFTDKEIAKELNVAERTIWSYWHKIRDVFQLYPTPGERHERKKIQTLMKARELGFLD